MRIEQACEALAEIEEKIWALRCRDRGERFVVPLAGSLPYPSWTVHDQPALNLLRQ